MTQHRMRIFVFLKTSNFMKHYLFVLTLIVCCSCVENPIDSQQLEEQNIPRSLRSLMTKSSSTPQEDSLTIMSKLQSDVDNLMMGRVIKKDSLFVLAIKKEDALFLGVSQDIYDKYLDYVDRLNEHLMDK